MMMWNAGWCGGWGMLMGAIFWIVVLVGLFWGIQTLRTNSRCDASSPTDALQILNARYARGEISREEYVRIKQDLEGSK